jgi:hypothetical protein
MDLDRSEFTVAVRVLDEPTLEIRKTVSWMFNVTFSKDILKSQRASLSTCKCQWERYGPGR